MNPIEALFSEDVTRWAAVLKYPHTDRSPGVTVSVIRSGRPNADMSGVIVSQRNVSLTLTPAGGKGSVAVHLDADQAADLADAIDDAAATIREEGR